MATTDVQSLDDKFLGLDQLDGKIDRRYTFSATGRNVNVYVIDSGIDVSHREFEGRAKIAYVAPGLSTERPDCTGHGTHVAGIIGGKNTGVAKEVTLHSVRVIGCEQESLNSDIVTALEWVTQNHVKPAIINMSLGPKLKNGAYPDRSPFLGMC
jgi:subtilisin family serine protease